jgi:hypothetical protein
MPEWTDEELAVLRSANGDGPGPRSLSNTLSAVGAAGAVATGVVTAKGAALAGSAASTATTVKWGGAAVLAKWLGIVALGGTVVTGSVAYLRHTTPVAVVAPSSQRAGVALPVRNARVEATSTPEPESVTATETPETTSPSPSARKGAARAQPDISLEITALDTARSALRGGRAPEALAALDRYDATFGRSGGLRVEATALRIDALLRSGRRDRAESLASAFLAHNPKSPYAARIRALVSGSTAR